LSVELKISRLEKFVAQNPALAGIPFLTIEGRHITPHEALSYLRAGRYVTRIIEGLAKLGIDPPEEELPWELAEEFWKRYAAARQPGIYALAGYLPSMTPAEAYEHIKARDQVGQTLVKAYDSLLKFMRARMEVAT